MLAGLITARGSIRLVEAPEPGPPEQPGQIVFQPEWACLCGSDLPYFDDERGPYPRTLGHSLHEMIGTVAATSGQRFRPGDRVLAVPVNQVGLFERYVVSEQRAIPLDPRAATHEALLAQPLGTVLFALEKLGGLLDQTVAVVGQGPIGHLFNLALRNLGAREIVAVDRLRERLRLSAAHGATAVVDASREEPVAGVRRALGGELADVVVEAVGHRDQALELCVRLCRQAGRLLYFGVPPEQLERVAWRELFVRNLTVHTSVNPDFRRHFPLAMRWIAEGRIDVSRLITHRFPLAEIQQAFEVFRDRREGALKVLIEFPAARKL
jgi:threonine dehydrogenase-like Zn-dependent dehydrogenase